MSPGRSSFSRSRLYWNPEQPPPTTATRRPEPCRFSRSIVSFTIAAALSVRRTIAGGSLVVVVCGATFCVLSIVFSSFRKGSGHSQYNVLRQGRKPTERLLRVHRAPSVDREDLSRHERLRRQEEHGSRDLLGGTQ